MTLALCNRSPGTLTAGTCATTLTTALVSGTPVTSLAVAALPQAIASGATIQISIGPTGFDTATLSANASSGATAISVTSYTPSASWAIGTAVSPNQLGRNSATLGWPGDTPGPATGTIPCILTDTVNGEVVWVTGGQGTTALTVIRAAEPIGGVQTPITVATGAYLAPTATVGAVLRPASSPTLTANPPVSGTVYQNLHGVTLTIIIPITATAIGGSWQLALGPTATPPSWGGADQIGVSGELHNATLRIPPGWYWSVTVTNATIGTADILGE